MSRASRCATHFYEEFWRRVNISATGCWEWRGGRISGGYGEMYLGRRRDGILAHRLMWMLCKGDIPSGMLVCHHCDTPSCVRPDHLFLGTHRDNMQDAARKGRTAPQIHPELMPRGDRHWTRTHPECLPRGDKHWTRMRVNELGRG